MKPLTKLTLKLEIYVSEGTGVGDQLVKTFESLKDLKDPGFVYIAENINNVIIAGVPSDTEEEVSKYIFKSIDTDIKKTFIDTDKIDYNIKFAERKVGKGYFLVK